MRGRTSWMVGVSVALVASCAGMGVVGELAVNFGRNLLLNTAQNNFGEKYSADFGKLVDLLLLKELRVNEGSEKQPASAGTSSKPVGNELLGASLTADTRPLQLDLTVLREQEVEGMTIPVPIEDGDLLRDGVGRDSAGDNLKIQFTAGSDCYVYAIWVDATSWATPLFPVGPTYTSANPVEAGRRYTFPEGDQWFYLDDYRGVENLYFLASREPISDLSGVLVELAGQTREFRGDQGSLVTINEPADLTRGLAGVRTGAGALVQSSSGKESATASQLFMASDGADQLLITRWFRHE